MHRKLIHTVRALGITLSLLIAGLIVAVPIPATPGFADGDPATSTALSAEEVQAKASAAKAHSRHRRAQARDAMTLPFFSFAQGLRRGNRS